MSGKRNYWAGGAIIMSAVTAMMLPVVGFSAEATSAKRDIRDVLGSAHVAGRYNFTDKEFLDEGADKLLELGTRVIKLWFNAHVQKVYPYNMNWPEYGNLVDLAKTPYFKGVFSKPFSTYILETYAPERQWHYFTDGMSPEDIEYEKKALYEITKYLLTEYKGTGKTFILQNWEGDWVLTPPQTTEEPTATAIQGMIDWLNARQDGVELARKEVGSAGVTVAHAAEVNLIKKAMEGKTCVTNDVLPKTRCDLYSYSAWDTSLVDAKLFRKALDYLAEKAPNSKMFGDKHIFVGEYGAPENEFDQLKIMKEATEVALDWGVRYLVYWQLYCNEPAGKYEGRPKNSDCRGFWLIRPDGTKAGVWDYFKSLLEKQ